MQIIDRAIQNADNPLPMLLERAEIVGEVDGPNARLSTLTALSKQFPRQADVLAHLAKSLQDSGRDADAIKAGHSALKADDGQLSPQQRAELHYDIGQLLAKQGQLDQAVHQFSLAIQTNVHATNAYIALGKTHAQRRELTPALQAFERAIDLDADNVQPYCEAAKVLKDARNYAKAEQMLRRAKQLQPDNLEINRLLSAMMTMNLVHSAEIPA
jgi:tetratricopeptide (TPR) repeat protein